MATPALVTGGVAYRIWQGDNIVLITEPLFPSAVAVSIQAVFRIQYDDGSTGELTCPSIRVSSGAATLISPSNNPATGNGWVVACWTPQTSGNATYGGMQVRAVITRGLNEGTNIRGELFDVDLGADIVALGRFTPRDPRAVYIFQGTVVSDATVGTHVSTLTVTFGTTNSTAQLMYAQIIATGAGGSAQSATILDGSGNTIATLFSASAAGTYDLPFSPSSATGVSAQPIFISGPMSLVLTSTTSTVSQTQTFSLGLRISNRNGVLPTATLADNTGTPTLTTNTARVY